MTARAAAAFDLCGDLPEPGVTVLEASAGTGKTFTIAALVARYVAEGVPLSEMLAVTFTRLATGELRDRVRARLVSAEDGLGRLLDAGDAPDPADRVLGLLASGSEAQLRARRDRLAAALAVFDSATITTIHGFCQLVLGGLGVAGGVAEGADLREDITDVVNQVVDDLFVRRSIGWGVPAFTRRDGGVIAGQVVGHRDAPLVPPPGDTTPGRRRRFGEAVRTEVERRLGDSNLLTYDDLLIRLRQTLLDPTRGPAACNRLRSRYSIVLVDEFQDTDAVQWESFEKAFGTGDTTLVLIGDPKQAIYAFRGADVYTYLAAAGRADHRFTLTENWRSDAALLSAYDAFLDPLKLGHADIPYRQVEATPAHAKPGLIGAAAGSLRVRVLHGSDHHLPVAPQKRTITKGAATAFVAQDLASDVIDLLSSGAQLVDYRDDGEVAARRPVLPGHVAVLVRTNRQASTIHEALRARGVPAVVAGTENVFATAAARHWLYLLEGLEQPASTSRAAAVAIGPWLGWPAEKLADANDSEWEDVHANLHRWAEVLHLHGVAALFRAVVGSQEMPGRLLGGNRGERQLTDLSHIAQLLHVEGSGHQIGLHALTAWLHRRIDDSGAGADEAEERSRRLDSDADAVQVLTVHRAKGLEFPIVYCPFLWDAQGAPPSRGRPVLFHDPQDGGVRKLDVGGEQGSEYSEHARLETDEERGEDIRLLYVALTRAKHQAVVWWARVSGCEHSPLGRLLFARDKAGNVSRSGSFAPKDGDVQAALQAIAGPTGGLMTVERCPPARRDRWQGNGGTSTASLSAAVFDRRLDLVWRRSSYSSITAAAHAAHAAHGAQIDSEPESPGVGDEPVEERRVMAASSQVEAALEAVLKGTPSLLAGTPGGTEVGTFVHQILSEADFAASNLESDLAVAIGGSHLYSPASIGSHEALATGLAAAISTPLGPLAGSVCLRDVTRADRLDELGFELPVAGGERSTGSIEVARISELFVRHVAPDEPLGGYGRLMAEASLAAEVKGYLTGSIDLVLRLPGGPAGSARRGADDRYFVVDYKTNRLGTGDGSLSAWDYRPEALEAEMQHVHYPLQAVLYMVALHRYLRWRLPGYDAAKNLGGALYMFLRGMVGPDTPLVEDQPCGVFSWATPPRLVTDLSDLLDAGSAGEARR
ncbi:MAG: UvrD-helicase domain-containing protein [Acidimicrobiales bacterium]